MAASRFKALGAFCFILILACKAWSGAAYMNQQSKWLTKHLGHLDAEHVVRRPDRHLQETVRSGKIGFKTYLVNQDHKLHERWGLNGMERVMHSALKSESRASGLDAKSRAATYYGGPHSTGLGRKALQVLSPSPAPSPSYEEPVEVTPGSYSMAFSIGTPAQDFIAIADTGSDLVWIQCDACTVCFEQSSPLFSPGNSSTYQNLGCSDACNLLGNNQLQCTPTCQYTYGYGDQSTTKGDFSTETLNLGLFNATNATASVPNFQFGCGLQNNGTFQDTDGIVGLARGPISFPSQIAPYLNNHTKFSYCLVSKGSNSSVTSPIIFGEAAVPENVSDLVYTPILSPYNVSDVPYYYVNLQGINVGGQNLSIPSSTFQIDSNGNGGTIFDSGTTYTILASDGYDILLNEYTAQLSGTYPQVDLSQSVGLDLCYDISAETTVGIPNLTFQFENADFDLMFDNIMVVFGDAQSTYMCLALMRSSGLSIFGNTQQQGFLVVTEVDNLQIGWKPEYCEGL